MNKIILSNSTTILDFCGTLVSNQTADSFIFSIIRNNPLKVFIFFILWLYKKISKLTKTNIFNLNLDKTIFLKLIKGFSYQVINSAAIRFSNQLILKYKNNKLIDYINNNSYSNIIIISAAYSIYIKYFIKSLPIKVKFVFASNLVFSNNIFTGNIDRSLFGEDKVLFINEKINFKQDIDNRLTLFTDSISDLPLIRFCNETICVNPDKYLLSVAIQNNWKILI